MTSCVPFVICTQLLPTKSQETLLPPIVPLTFAFLPFVAAACLWLVKPDWDVVHRQGGG